MKALVCLRSWRLSLITSKTHKLCWRQWQQARRLLLLKPISGLPARSPAPAFATPVAPTGPHPCTHPGLLITLRALITPLSSQGTAALFAGLPSGHRWQPDQVASHCSCRTSAWWPYRCCGLGVVTTPPSTCHFLAVICCLSWISWLFLTFPHSAPMLIF